MKSIFFILEGQVIPKKNSRRLFVKNGRIINIPSQRYKDWHDSCLIQLKEQDIPKLYPNYEMTCVFWFKDKRPHDLDNALASICDLLQDAEIIKSDDGKMLTSIKGVYGGVSKDTPRVKIELRSEV